MKEKTQYLCGSNKNEKKQQRNEVCANEIQISIFEQYKKLRVTNTPNKKKTKLILTIHIKCTTTQKYTNKIIQKQQGPLIGKQ